MSLPIVYLMNVEQTLMPHWVSKSLPLCIDRNHCVPCIAAHLTDVALVVNEHQSSDDDNNDDDDITKELVICKLDEINKKFPNWESIYSYTHYAYQIIVSTDKFKLYPQYVSHALMTIEICITSS